jgi:hypothetical protein
MKHSPTKQAARNLPFCLTVVLFLAAGICTGCPVEGGAYEQSAAPETATDTVAKAAQPQKSVTFRLTSVHPAGSIWKVYDGAEGGILTAVAATYKKTVNPADGEPISDLILTSFTNDIDPMTYFVSVTERDKAESERLALTVSGL